MSDEVTISTQGLVKQFKTRRGTVTAVDGVTLQVRRGETYGLIGPDGAGKTTTTRTILGLLTRTGGESSILGYDSMRDTYKIRERVGYIAQQFALPGDLTVMENMRFFANVQGVSREEQGHRIPELLEFAGLSDFTRRLGSHLSGGMKKKLALACSLVHEPQVVMMDEPTLGVDPVSRREFWNLLGDLRTEKGTTIFVCTPYMDEAERCNWVGLMYEGRLIAHPLGPGVDQVILDRREAGGPLALHNARRDGHPRSVADGGYDAAAREHTSHQVEHKLVAAHPVGRGAAWHDDGVKIIRRDRIGGGVHFHRIAQFAVVLLHAGHADDGHLGAGLAHAQERIPQFQLLVVVLSQNSDVFTFQFHTSLLLSNLGAKKPGFSYRKTSLSAGSACKQYYSLVEH